MRRNLSTYADRGWWISDDRVNAFLSASGGAIAEIGFHGKQPVSRNSRILSHPEGALTFTLEIDGKEHPILPDGEVEVYPAGCSWKSVIGDIVVTPTVTVHQNLLVASLEAHNVHSAHLCIRFDLRALFTKVQGTREWERPSKRDHWLFLTCRDSIVLSEWLKRKGPYAGDFLIPEPVRRMIFRNRRRSGSATEDDLRPEFRDVALPIYDARTYLKMGGEDWSLEGQGEFYVWKVAAVAPVTFVIELSADPITVTADDAAPAIHRAQLNRYGQILDRSPGLALSGFPEVSEFFKSVPSIVESCKVRDLGMTRATPGAYYWIWAWDNMVTGVEMLRWGDAAGVRRVLDFINAHRDEGGIIPARWTRDLQPLDSPLPGALESLYAALLMQYVSETGDRDMLQKAYAGMANHLRHMATLVDSRGLFANLGFYPDLPISYGRSERSAVALEVGACYLFCRCISTAAQMIDDPPTVTMAGDLGALVRKGFHDNFWDDDKGFFIDSLDMETRDRNVSFPLFTLLFLQSPLGLRLVGDRIDALARFMGEHHLGEHGTGLVPAWDLRRGTEDALRSWYPHWDLYMLKIFRRAGHVQGILKWLTNLRDLLTHLGYVPEFISLEKNAGNDTGRWRNHGAFSNLNCVTGCYRGLLEAIVGLEFDSGGMTVVPLALPLGSITLDDLVYKQTHWTIEVVNDGPALEQIRIDGQPYDGCLKVPMRYYDGGSHRIDIRYGLGKPATVFREVINCEVLSWATNDNTTVLRMRALGSADIGFEAATRPVLHVDGVSTACHWNEETRQGRVELPLFGEHELAISSE